jgi:hypothetical protein
MLSGVSSFGIIMDSDAPRVRPRFLRRSQTAALWADAEFCAKDFQVSFIHTLEDFGIDAKDLPADGRLTIVVHDPSGSHQINQRNDRQLALWPVKSDDIACR